MENLYQRLIHYSNSDMIPMHMPGHKRNPGFSMENPYSFDVTEVDGTDDLHHPQEILKREMERAARLYGAEHTIFLVNGSTGGILTAISACCRRNGKILMARNCHKSVYHAAFLLNLHTEYLMPEMGASTGILGGISLESVKEAVERGEKPDCVMITSPTYEGVASPIREIAAYLHERNIPLVVDGAHGAHFPFQIGTPESAVEAGADLVIQSLHKTLPALTQTGLLHRGGNLVSAETVRMYEQIYQTSSPSYVLMGSISQCLDFLEDSETAFAQYNVRLGEFYDKLEELEKLRAYTCENRDLGKVVITTERTNLSGIELEEQLRQEFHIELEMSQARYGVAMTSVADSEDNLACLAEALLTIDQRAELVTTEPVQIEWMLPTACDTAYNAYHRPHRSVALADATNHVAGEYVYLYPPGIPYLVPGELISQEMADLLSYYQSRGFSLKGMADEDGHYIQVVV